jgi:prepilin-type N-terminal cleavage/methylation domain-containing protein
MEMRRQPLRRSRGFTLLELLVVIAIIATLATMLITSLGSAKKRTMIAVAKSNIQAIKAALAMYESDTGRYPCRMGKLTDKNWFNNDIAYCWAALKNRATPSLMGGPNSPYLDWKPEQVGYAAANSDQSNYGSNSGSPVATPVPPGTLYMSAVPGDQSFLTPGGDNGGGHDGGQNAHIPGTFGATDSNGKGGYVFLDPWGNAYVYVEWASVPLNIKDPLATSQSNKVSSIPNYGNGGGSQTTEDHILAPHSPTTFDIYSFGPNGVNEGGEGDDVASWSDVHGK